MFWAHASAVQSRDLALRSRGGLFAGVVGWRLVAARSAARARRLRVRQKDRTLGGPGRTGSARASTSWPRSRPRLRRPCWSPPTARGGARWVAILGILCILPAVGNDGALAFGFIENAIPLLPHAFLLYAFGVSGTLLLRYRVGKDELEKAARSLHEKTEELRHSYAELRLVQNELVTKKQLAAVGELAAAIAHEVRNPLAVIVNAVAGLRRSAVRDEDRTMLLGIVDEEAARLNRLVTDLLRFARPVSVKRSPVSLLELANRSRSSAMLDGHQIVVQMDEDPDLQTVWVDPSLFRLVFDNLVENACQAMKRAARCKSWCIGASCAVKRPCASKSPTPAKAWSKACASARSIRSSPRGRAALGWVCRSCIESSKRTAARSARQRRGAGNDRYPAAAVGPAAGRATEPGVAQRARPTGKSA